MGTYIKSLNRSTVFSFSFYIQTILKVILRAYFSIARDFMRVNAFAIKSII